jgi:hypothetical protein
MLMWLMQMLASTLNSCHHTWLLLLLLLLLWLCSPYLAAALAVLCFLQTSSLADLARRLLLLECTKQPPLQPGTFPAAAAAVAGSGLLHPRLKPAWQQQQLLCLQEATLMCPGSSSGSGSSSGEAGSNDSWLQRWHPELLNVLLWEFDHAGLGSSVLSAVSQQATAAAAAMQAPRKTESPAAAAANSAEQPAGTYSSNSGSTANDFKADPDQQLSGNCTSSKGAKNTDHKPHRHFVADNSSSTNSSGGNICSGDAAAQAAAAYVQGCMGMLCRAALGSWVLSWHSYMEAAGGEYGSCSKR